MSIGTILVVGWIIEDEGQGLDRRNWWGKVAG